MNTKATVVIAQADQEAAQLDFPGMFTAGFCKSNAEDKTVASHYVSSGFFFDSELDKIVNEVTWGRYVKFGDVYQVLAELDLVQCEEVQNEPEAEAP